MQCLGPGFGKWCQTALSFCIRWVFCQSREPGTSPSATVAMNIHCKALGECCWNVTVPRHCLPAMHQAGVRRRAEPPLFSSCTLAGERGHSSCLTFLLGQDKFN